MCSSIKGFLLISFAEHSVKSGETQGHQFAQKWRGTQVVYDSEKSGRDYEPNPVAEGVAPSLVFESRFESGNLRQARRM